MPRLCYNLIVISEAVVQQIKKYITDFRFIASALAVVYAACTHIFVLEGLPARMQEIEEWKAKAEDYHHKIDLAILQNQTTLTNIEKQLTNLTEWVFNGRTQRL